MTQQNLNEGLRPNDLAKMVHPIFEVDTYCSKMGEDRDVCVVSFQVKDRGPAKDMMEFIEKGYTFVLDADISSGENEQGEYSVFVELPRTEELSENINELIYGLNKLTGVGDFQFTYYKTPIPHQATQESLNEIIPSTPAEYDAKMHRIRTEGIKQFFNKTLMDDLTLENDIITIHKAFGQKVHLKIVSEEVDETILEDNSPIILNDETIAEMFWLSKVLGDYNINRVGENLIFDNGTKQMVLQRVS